MQEAILERPDNPAQMAKSDSKLRDRFSARLRAARLAAGLSQRELGRRMGLSEDVVSSRVTRYERGTSEPDFQTASLMARELDVPLAYLVADSDVLADIILAADALSATEQKKLASHLCTWDGGPLPDPPARKMESLAKKKARKRAEKLATK